jgi:hypothetical protein
MDALDGRDLEHAFGGAAAALDAAVRVDLPAGVGLAFAAGQEAGGGAET